MSRIHRILSRAERDGTMTRLTWPLERHGGDSLPAAAGGWDIATTAIDATSDPDGPPPGADQAADPTLLGARPVFGVKLDRMMVTALDPFSAAAEHYRSLRSRIAREEGGVPRRVILATSPGRGDGTSVTVGNLALAMAQEFDRRALVIDADLRHARLHTLLGIAREPGLVDVLTGSARLEEALVSLPGHRLVVLPAGAAHTQPAELLGSAPMRRLLELLRQRFDRLLVDSAPAPLADSAALQPLADGVLLVVRAGVTPRPDIERALGAIPAPRLMGMVLNASRTADGLSTA